MSVQTSASPAKLAQQLGACALQPQPLRGPVTRIHEVWRAPPSLFPGLECGMVTQICGDVDVGSAGPDGIEAVVAGSPDHRHPAHQRIGRTRHPDSPGGLREHRAQLLHELAQRPGTGQRAHPPKSHTAARAVEDHQGADVDQGARAGERITDAG
jgi:hypothetical protein